jgi:hypothetical protein
VTVEARDPPYGGASARPAARTHPFRRRRRQWVVTLAVALVVIMVLSGVPVVVDAASGAHPAQAATSAAAPAVVANASSPPSSHVTNAVVGPNPGMCSLGVRLYCSGADGANATPAAPAGTLAGKPSNWKNITPPSGKPNPSDRILPAMAYYPSGHETLLFGGDGPELNDFFEDTWGYSGGAWKLLINESDCTSASCPAARAGAMLAYDAQNQSMLLFGGYSILTLLVGPANGSSDSPYLTTENYETVYNDTWEFANNTWTNVTSKVGKGPSPRFSGVMTYDPSDNYDVLFGGEGASYNSLGDTWKFSEGLWTNLTSSLTTAPSSRAGASIAYAPNGWVLLFGGEDITGDGATAAIVQNPCDGGGGIAWWFYQGAWTVSAGYNNYCPPPEPANSTASEPTPAVTPVGYPPCGRVDGALGWSPKNQRFVLYGGYGPDIVSSGGCSTTNVYLNDSWTYDLPNGGGFLWNNATSPPGPPARAYMGYSSDYSSDYFEIFGGQLASGSYVNETWRFYEILYARLSGPTGYNTNPGALNLLGGDFFSLGYGGTGELDYQFTIKNVRNDNKLTYGQCDWFYNTTGTALPYDGSTVLDCEPVGKDYGIYHIELVVTDEGNTSHPTATANWTFEVVPPEQMRLYSEYAGDFYANVNFENTFTIYAEVANQSATSMTATIGGHSLTFVQGSQSRWWNATNVQMSGFSYGAELSVTAQFGSNWTQNLTDTLTIVDTPSWLLTLFKATGAHRQVTPAGAGPFNKSYTISEEYDWSLSNSSNFSIPVPLVGGSYGLIPSVNVTFNATSAGDLTVKGTLSLSTPTITIGPASLKISAFISMAGTFEVNFPGVQWVSAQATIGVTASLNASIPIYGFSLFGINVGFTLQLGISPSITLTMILAPLTAGGTAIIPGIDLEIQRFLASFTLSLSAAINFGIGIASVGLGVGLSIALAFTISPFGVTGGWVNGTIFVTAQFLWWSDSFNIVGPANIYSWSGPAGPASEVYVAPGYNNGTGTKWTVQVEYYKASDYDAKIWNPASSSGPAISDIYPWTEVSAAAAYNGADLFFTDANTSEPATYGLLVSAAHLDSATNKFTGLPAPWDTDDYELANPQATTLPDGEIYVVWSALPSSEASVNSPLNLTSIELQGAVFDPGTNSWGAIHTFSSGGFAESYQVDAVHNSGVLLELTASTPLLTKTSTERLVEYSLASGDVLANVSVSNLSEVVAVRGASDLAVVETIGGNYSLISLPTGGSVTVDDSPPAYAHVLSETFVQDSSTVLVILYRANFSSDLVLYNTSSSTTIGNLTLGTDVLQGEGIAAGGTVYVFVRSAHALTGWSDPGGTFSNFTSIPLSGVVSFGLVQAGSSIVVYAIAPTGGNSTEPIRELELTELGASLAAVPVPAGVKVVTGAIAPPDYALYLGVVAGLVVLLLAVVALVGRRRRAPRGPPKPFAPASPPPGVSGEPAASPPPSPPPSGPAPP